MSFQTHGSGVIECWDFSVEHQWKKKKQTENDFYMSFAPLKWSDGSVSLGNIITNVV